MDMYTSSYNILLLFLCRLSIVYAYYFHGPPLNNERKNVPFQIFHLVFCGRLASGISDISYPAVDPTVLIHYVINFSTFLIRKQAMHALADRIILDLRGQIDVRTGTSKL